MEKGFIALKINTTNPKFVSIEVIKVNKLGKVSAVGGCVIPNNKRTTIHLNKKTLNTFDQTDDFIGQ